MNMILSWRWPNIFQCFKMAYKLKINPSGFEATLGRLFMIADFLSFVNWDIELKGR